VILFGKSRAFSPAVVTQGGKIVWLAGQTALTDLDGKSIAHDFDAQARTCFTPSDPRLLPEVRANPLDQSIGGRQMRPSVVGPLCYSDQCETAPFMVVPETKDGSPAKNIEANSAAGPTEKADAKASKPHRPKVLAVIDNYERPGYGNALGYAEASRNGPQHLFSNW
jgi:hypothetical protein